MKNFNKLSLVFIFILLFNVSCFKKPVKPPVSSDIYVETANLLPEDPILYISIRSIPSTWDNVKKSTIWQKFISTEAGERFVERLTQVGDEMKFTFSITPQELLEIFNGEIGFAMYDKGKSEDYRFVILANIKDTKQKFEKKKSRTFEKSNEDKAITSNYKGITIEMIPSEKIYYAFVSDYFVVCSDSKIIEKVIDLSSSPNTSLGASSNFKDVYSKLNQGSDVILFADGYKMSELMKDKDKKRKSYIKYLSKVKGYGISFSWAGNVPNESAYILLGEEIINKPTFQSLLKATKPKQVANYISDDTDLYLSYTINDPTLFWRDVIIGGLREASSEGYQKVKFGLAFLESALGFDVEYDLLPTLGGEIALVVTDFSQLIESDNEIEEDSVSYRLGIERPKPKISKDALMEEKGNIMLFIEVKNKAKAEDILWKLFKERQKSKTTYKDISITILEKEDDMSTDEGSKSSICYAFIDDFIVIAGSVDAIKNSIQSKNSKETLSQNTLFRDEVNSFKDYPVLLGYVNLESSISNEGDNKDIDLLNALFKEVVFSIYSDNKGIGYRSSTSIILSAILLSQVFKDNKGTIYDPDKEEASRNLLELWKLEKEYYSQNNKYTKELEDLNWKIPDDSNFEYIITKADKSSLIIKAVGIGGTATGKVWIINENGEIKSK